MLSVASHYGFMNDERLTEILCGNIWTLSILADVTRYYSEDLPIRKESGVIYKPSPDDHPRWTMKIEGMLSLCTLLDCRGNDGSRLS